MSTRSSITLKISDNKYRSIYCHHDGSPEWNGKMLVDYYGDRDKISALLDLGDISSLGKNPIGYWSDDFVYDAEKCMSYRERGEISVDAREFASPKEVVDWYDDCDYHYFFIDGVWCLWMWEGEFESVRHYLQNNK